MLDIYMKYVYDTHETCLKNVFDLPDICLSVSCDMSDHASLHPMTSNIVRTDSSYPSVSCAYVGCSKVFQCCLKRDKVFCWFLKEFSSTSVLAR